MPSVFYGAFYFVWRLSGTPRTVGRHLGITNERPGIVGAQNEKPQGTKEIYIGAYEDWS